MKNPIKILIIEDNEDDAQLEIEQLKSGGYTIVVQIVETLQSMREALKNETWDFIISDFALPQFSGLEALEELKESGLDIPFILISGTIGEETAVAAMKAGAHDYIMKDNLSRLLPAFERELREAKLRDQKKQADEALKVSVHDLLMQNEEYQHLNSGYLKLNEELKTSLTHILKINNELILAKNKAEESDKLKSAFLANMSHEIRTPLNGIMGFSTLLKDPDLPKEKADTFLQIIESSGLQLLNIINDILEISKIEAGQMYISLKSANVSELLMELHQQFLKEAELKNLEFILLPEHLDENIVTRTDGNRLRQIIGNLLSNAIKFTSKGRIEFGMSVRGNSIEVFISDSGIGIAEDDQSFIFEPFRKVATPVTQLYGGTGLGLAISKALAEKLGGSISLSSEPDKGATFTLILPFPENNGNENQINSKTESNTDNPMEQKTILVAEDEIYNFYYIQELLKPLKVITLHANNGLEAVELAKNNSEISLVLMDIRMPEMDGLEATKQIKKLRPLLPVIAQSAYASREDTEKAKAYGFDYYLSKPIVRDLFIEVVSKYLS